MQGRGIGSRRDDEERRPGTRRRQDGNRCVDASRFLTGCGGQAKHVGAVDEKNEADGRRCHAV